MGIEVTLNNIRIFGMYGIKFFDFVKTGSDLSVSFSLDALIWWVVCLIFCCITAYVLGSINFAIVISKIKYGADIREFGSNNAGTTNMLRTYGKKAAILTFAGDILKSVVAAFVGWFLLGEPGGYVACFCCVLGHVFPIFYKFKGGKGVAVAAAGIAFLEPLLFLVLIIVFVIVLLVTRYVSLSSVMAALMLPVLLGNIYSAVHTQRSAFYFLVVLSILGITITIIVKHIPNLKRILDHTESKLSFKKHKES